jgi:hypothetical protein
VFAQEDAQYSQYNRFRLRTYDNRIGRFLSPDPVVIGPGSGNAESPISGSGGGEMPFGFSRGGGGSDYGLGSGRFGPGPQVEDPPPDEMNTISEGDPPRNVLDFTGYVIDGMNEGDDASSQGVTPWDVGVEWLTGTGPRHRNFTNGDVFTEMLRQHDHVLSTKASIPGMIANGTMKGSAPYRLSGVQGVGKYVKDYSTLATFGTTGNLAVTYLGSYNLQWNVSAVNGNSATVMFTVNNSSTIQSATRPPVIGYYSWWQNSVGSWINSSFSSGPMSPTTQTFNWTETVTW